MTRKELCLEVAELNKKIKVEENEEKRERLIKKRDKLRNYLEETEYMFDDVDYIPELDSMEMMENLHSKGLTLRDVMDTDDEI